MAYVVSNVPHTYETAVWGALEAEDGFKEGNAVYVGKPLEAYAHKGQYPDATVESIDKDHTTLFLQSFAGHQRASGVQPYDIRESLFLTPFTDPLPASWEYDREATKLTIPMTDWTDIRERYQSFLEDSAHFDNVDWKWFETEADVDQEVINDLEAAGRREMVDDLFLRFDSVYGPIRHDAHADTVTLNLKQLTAQYDIYPDVLEEVDVAAEPDIVRQADMQGYRPQEPATYVSTGNVIDHFPTPQIPGNEDNNLFMRDVRFLQEIDQMTADTYLIEFYSVGTESRGRVVPQRTREDIEKATAAVGQVEYTFLDTNEVAGRVHHMDMGASNREERIIYQETEQDSDEASGAVFLLKAETK